MLAPLKEVFSILTSRPCASPRPIRLLKNVHTFDQSLGVVCIATLGPRDHHDRQYQHAGLFSSRVNGNAFDKFLGRDHDQGFDVLTPLE